MFTAKVRARNAPHLAVYHGSRNPIGCDIAALTDRLPQVTIGNPHWNSTIWRALSHFPTSDVLTKARLTVRGGACLWRPRCLRVRGRDAHGQSLLFPADAVHLRQSRAPHPMCTHRSLCRCPPSCPTAIPNMPSHCETRAKVAGCVEHHPRRRCCTANGDGAGCVSRAALFQQPLTPMAEAGAMVAPLPHMVARGGPWTCRRARGACGRALLHAFMSVPPFRAAPDILTAISKQWTPGCDRDSDPPPVHRHFGCA